MSDAVANRRWVSANRSRPAVVSASGDRRPSNSATPWRASSAFNCCDSVGCDTFSRRAARDTPPSAAIA